jgi:hypothetical protein
VTLDSGIHRHPESEDRFECVPTSSQPFPKGVTVNSDVPA